MQAQVRVGGAVWRCVEVDGDLGHLEPDVPLIIACGSQDQRLGVRQLVQRQIAVPDLESRLVPGSDGGDASAYCLHGARG